MSEQMIREAMQRQGFEADEIDEAVLLFAGDDDGCGVTEREPEAVEA